ncbi:hypothetical protein PpBr36_04244 [Pyricularia pennisetigena]|uniref:hypothetical protein n=1 Tax=Pyricularia pennisetigena TaxID=1578925 RepID=UPI00114FF4C0|nr:hypothetical protein PpBr36_04244 [Pyricularia pennisetigena]TLS26425.1 hypothetical protein PpBr36_04244 [Pyricularia pennisetigena]
MSPTKNTALYMDEDCKLSVKRNFPVPQPEQNEALVEVLFSGVNPADIKHGTQLGIRPVVMGYEFSGRIISAPDNSGFRPGDAVAGGTPSGLGRPARFGTHQDYLTCPADLLFHVPTHLAMEHAACLTVVTRTAADALYNLFGLPLPGATGRDGLPRGSLLVWGAGSALGCCAVQLARASGVTDILVTASPARHDMLRGLGATRCFDYRRSDVEAELTASVAAGAHPPVRWALDAVGAPGVGDAPGTAQRLRASAPDAVLVSATVQGPDFLMPLAYRDHDLVIHPEGAPGPVTIPGDAEKSALAARALAWAVENYNKGFVLPSVDVFSGASEDALKELESSAAGGRFGKLAIKHPLQ